MDIYLDFKYDEHSQAIYSSKILDEDLIQHEKDLFCGQNASVYFTHYQKDENDYVFPFFNYGLLSTFWKYQDSSKIQDLNYLKIKWIYQLTQGLKELHLSGQYYGNLSSECIIIDDDLNVKYGFFKDVIPYSRRSYVLHPYFYLPPSYFEVDTQNANDIQEEKKKDIYALGIIMKEIVDETTLDIHEYMKGDFNNPNEYLKKKGFYKAESDQLWIDLTNDVINECFKPFDQQQPIDKISENLDSFLKNHEINIKFNYKTSPIPIVDSSIEREDVIIPAPVTKLITFCHVADTLAKLEQKYEKMSIFFPKETTIINPFNLGIKDYSFYIFLKYDDFSEMPDVCFSTMVKPKSNDIFKDFDTFVKYDDLNINNTINSLFFSDNFAFCNLNQFSKLIHKEKHDIINLSELQSWIIYLSYYLYNIEGDSKDSLLPLNFSSETVLISLMTNEDVIQYQLSIFPYPTNETHISKLYKNAHEGCNSDIYSFGILLFQLLGLYPCNYEPNIEDFESETMIDLYKKFKEIDPDFRYNIHQLKDITDFIESCITPGNQPKSFNDIYDYLFKNPISEETDLNEGQLRFKFCLDNQKMRASRLASIADILQKDPVNEIVSNFVLPYPYGEIEEEEEGEGERTNSLNFVKTVLEVYDEVKNDSDAIKITVSNTKSNAEKNKKTENDNNNAEKTDNDNNNNNAEKTDNDNDNNNAEKTDNDNNDNNNNDDDDDEITENDNNEEDIEIYDDDNQFIRILLDFAKTEFNDNQSSINANIEKNGDEISNTDTIKVENNTDDKMDSKYNDLFFFLRSLRKAEIKFNESLKPVNEKIVDNSIYKEFDMLERRIIESQGEFDKKCSELKPIKINLENLTFASARFALSQIVKLWCPLIPHTLIAYFSGYEDEEDENEENENDDENNENQNDNENDEILNDENDENQNDENDENDENQNDENKNDENDENQNDENDENQNDENDENKNNENNENKNDNENDENQNDDENKNNENAEEFEMAPIRYFTMDDLICFAKENGMKAKITDENKVELYSSPTESLFGGLNSFLSRIREELLPMHNTEEEEDDCYYVI